MEMETPVIAVVKVSIPGEEKEIPVVVHAGHE
jgi:hypothetical protein